MFGQIIKTTKGKWALVLAVLAILALIGGITKGQDDLGVILGGCAALIVISVLLFLSAAKSAKNGPAPGSVGIHVPQEEMDAFTSYGTLPNIKDVPVILGDGETAVYYCDAVRVETKNRMLGKTGSGAGVSFRVAKGVRIRSGNGGSKNVYGNIEMSDPGQLVVTTQRIVFIAKNKAFAEKLTSLSAVSVIDNHLAIVTSNKNYSLRMPMPEYACEIIKRCI